MHWQPGRHSECTRGSVDWHCWRLKGGLYLKLKSSSSASSVVALHVADKREFFLVVVHRFTLIRVPIHLTCAFMMPNKKHN